MIAYIKLAFRSLLDEVDWMDATTKISAKVKIEAMTENVAYPEWIKDKASLEAYYAGVTIRK